MRLGVSILLAAPVAAALVGFAPGAEASYAPVYHVALGDSLADVLAL